MVQERFICIWLSVHDYSVSNSVHLHEACIFLLVTTCILYSAWNITWNNFLDLQTDRLNYFSNVCWINGRKISKLSLQTSIFLIYDSCSLTRCARFNFLTIFSIVFCPPESFNQSIFISKFDQNLYVSEKFISRW